MVRSARRVSGCATLHALALAASATAQAPQEQRLHVGIDLGSEFAKVALELSEGPCSSATEAASGPCRGLVRRSDPVVLTAAGKRKTAAAVRFRDDTILYGDDALTTQIRHPSLTFVHLRQMLGWSSAPAADDARARGGGAWFEDIGGMPWYSWLEAEGRGTLRLTSCCPHLCISAEELNAILLAHLSDRVAATLEEERSAGMSRKVTGASTVVAVPPWWGLCERRALRDAAFMGGIGGAAPGELELIDSHLALAFKFLHEWSLRNSGGAAAAAVDGAPLEPANMTALLVDVGSTAVTATVVTVARTFLAGSAGAEAVTEESVVVEAVAWEPTVGGSSFDELLARILTARYTEQQDAVAAGSVGVQQQAALGEALSGARASATLLREAMRVKEVLSAGTVAYVTLEGLPVVGEEGFEGVLRTNITRAEFEAASEELVGRAVAPVGASLRRLALRRSVAVETASGLLQSVQLVGGGSRVPALQRALRRNLRLPEDPEAGGLALGAELNADEAIAHGAALLAVAKVSPKALQQARHGQTWLQLPSVAAGAAPLPFADAPTCGAIEEAALAESQQTVTRLRLGAAAVAEAGAAMYALEAFVLAELSAAQELEQADVAEGGTNPEAEAWRNSLLREEEWVWDHGNATATELRSRTYALENKAPMHRQAHIHAAKELEALRQSERDRDGGAQPNEFNEPPPLRKNQDSDLPEETLRFETPPGGGGGGGEGEQRRPMSKKEKERRKRQQQQNTVKDRMSQQQQSKDQTKERSHESREQRNERKKASPKQPSGQGRKALHPMTEKERYEQAQHSLNANGPKVGGAGGKRTGPSDPIEDARRKGAASQEQLEREMATRRRDLDLKSRQKQQDAQCDTEDNDGTKAREWEVQQQKQRREKAEREAAQRQEEQARRQREADARRQRQQQPPRAPHPPPMPPRPPPPPPPVPSPARASDVAAKIEQSRQPKPETNPAPGAKAKPLVPPAPPTPMPPPPPPPAGSGEWYSGQERKPAVNAAEAGRYDIVNPQMSQHDRFEWFQAYQKKKNEEQHRQKSERNNDAAPSAAAPARQKEMPVHPRHRKSPTIEYGSQARELEQRRRTDQQQSGGGQGGQSGGGNQYSGRAGTRPRSQGRP